MKDYIISDLHLGDEKILKYVRTNKFADVETMNKAIVTQWNAVVKPYDRVFVLGDVATTLDGLKYVKALNGTKVLIKGNHDKFPLIAYAGLFAEVEGAYLYQDKYIMTHIPIHPDHFYRYELNLHGHLHTELIDDDRYVNVNCDRIGFAPALIDELVK